MNLRNVIWVVILAVVLMSMAGCAGVQTEENLSGQAVGGGVIENVEGQVVMLSTSGIEPGDTAILRTNHHEYKNQPSNRAVKFIKLKFLGVIPQNSPDIIVTLPSIGTQSPVTFPASSNVNGARGCFEITGLDSRGRIASTAGFDFSINPTLFCVGMQDGGSGLLNTLGIYEVALPDMKNSFGLFNGRILVVAPQIQ